MQSSLHHLSWLAVAAYCSSFTVGLLGQRLSRGGRSQRQTIFHESENHPICGESASYTREYSSGSTCSPGTPNSAAQKPDNLPASVRQRRPQHVNASQRKVRAGAARRKARKQGSRGRPPARGSSCKASPLSRRAMKALLRGSILAYPYGKRPDWPVLYHTQSGRPVRLTRKLIDTKLTQVLLERQKGQQK